MSTPTRRYTGERSALEVHVPPPSIAGRPVACDQTDALEHVEMVRQQVGRNVNDALQLD